MKTERKQSNLHKILYNLIAVKAMKVDKYFWGRETKIVKQLVELYGEEFMLWLTPPEGYRMASMVYFKTKEGQTYLHGKLFEYRCQQGVQIKDKPEIILSSEKIGEDTMFETKKPRTLKEFLNLYAKDENRTDS